MSLAFDRAGTLWVGTRAGLAKFQGGRIQRVAMPIAGTPLLYSTSLIGDDLWVGTAQRVYVRAPDGRWADRKSVGKGKSGAVRLDLGGSRFLKQKKKKNK